MKPSIVVVGSFVKDLSFRCGRFPRAGETVIGTFSPGPGGKGSNQAVAAARAGARTRFVGAIGSDPFGVEAAQFLRSEGIDARLAEKRGRATGAAAILVDRASQNEIIVAIGASAAITPRDVPAGLIRGARVVICQGEANARINLHAFRLARRFGAIVRPGVMGGELADTPRASRSLSASVSADQATSKSGPTRPCRADRSPRYLLSLVGCIQLTARRQLD